MLFFCLSIVVDLLGAVSLPGTSGNYKKNFSATRNPGKFLSVETVFCLDSVLRLPTILTQTNTAMGLRVHVPL